MKTSRTTVTFHAEYEKDPIPIVSSAAFAAPVLAEGHFIPVLILDTTNRPDIVQLVKAHETLSPGDIEMVWLRKSIFNKDKISLFIEFIRPAEVSLIIDFDILDEGVLVEQILSTKTLYLQIGRPGDKFSFPSREPSIVIEIPDTGFKPTWDSLFYNALYKDYKRKGLSRKEARLAAKNVIGEWRNTFGKLQVKP